ncbi:MAG: 2Fe-2S iron-sulfur cluster-binding protein [Chlamydia sp.]
MARLIFKNTGEEVELADGSPLAEICEEQGIPFGCTEGVCGTCIVFVDGMENLSEPTEAELDFLGATGVKTERMMCQCKIRQGIVQITS